MTIPHRALVLDNEAVSRLRSTQQHDPDRAAVVLAIQAATGRVIVPTAVRAEVPFDRTLPVNADVNRLVPFDDPLDPAGANVAADLRLHVPGASVADAATALAAGRATGADIVEILTSDPGDLSQLVGHLDTDVPIEVSGL